jgi:hypothetical protein
MPMIGAFLFSFGIVIYGISQDLMMHLKNSAFDELILKNGGRSIYSKRASMARRISIAMITGGLFLLLFLL